MTAAARPENPTNSMTLEEMEQEVASPVPGVTSTKLDGDDVPEQFRGKTAQEVIEQAQKLSQALQLSEAERLRALQNPAPVATPVPVGQPTPEYRPLTKEQLEELYQENPLKAFEAMQNDALLRADHHFNQRFGRLEGSLAQTQEGWARGEFKEEFEVLGPQIQEALAKVTDKRVLNDKESWKDLISYIRGQPGNFEKIWEYKSGAMRDSATARAEQQADIGFQPRVQTRSAGPSAPVVLDATSRRVMEVLGTFKDEKEYIKWANMGNG